jgi:peptidoglycan/LPS O-acetylase OafA/YrhL
MRTDLRIDGLFWGCWAALLVDAPAYRTRISRWLTPWTWLAVVAALLGLARYEPFLEKYWQSLLLPWLLMGTVLHPSWAVSRALEAAPVRWIGRLSYSLYIWQQLWLMGSWRVSRPFPLGPFQELPLNLIATFACAIASYYVVEQPLLRLGSRLSRACEGPSARAVRSVRHDQPTARSVPDGRAAPSVVVCLAPRGQ